MRLGPPPAGRGTALVPGRPAVFIDKDGTLMRHRPHPVVDRRHVPALADVITFGAPWTAGAVGAARDERRLVAASARRRFDAAVVFSVCTQGALPAALVCRLAGIPLRLAHSRENPSGARLILCNNTGPAHLAAAVGTPPRPGSRCGTRPRPRRACRRRGPHERAAPVIAALAAEPVARIAVFRALVLGDLLCATPALRVLRAAWPNAELTLIGLPWARELASRLPQVDRFDAFCGFPGLPERRSDLEALPGFIATMRERSFDLLVQLHGSGSIVNPLLAGFGARRVAGFVEPGGFCVDPALHTLWPPVGHEIHRLLNLTDHLGLPRRGEGLDFPVRAEDHRALDAAVPALGDANARAAPIVCVHVGAQLPSRRWALERFATAADALAASGLRVVLTGTANEGPLVRHVRGLMRRPALDLSGRTGLWTLAALLQRVRLLVCNDTSVQHVAAALGTPGVAVSSGADAARWSPLDMRRHRVLAADVACRPCAHRECPTQHECARGVSVDAVVAAAFAAAARAVPEPAARDAARESAVPAR